MQDLTSALNKIDKHMQKNNMSCKLGHELYHMYVHIINVQILPLSLAVNWSSSEVIGVAA